MTYIPYSPELGCKYTLTGPDGTIATFNDSTDANYVGTLTDITGLDSAGVRESADDLVQADGGWHGNFWFGRRPISMSGTVYSPASATARTARIDKLRTASNALRADAILSWVPLATGAVAMRTWVRRQQPLRITGTWNKDFQLLLVSQFAPLFSDALHTSGSGTSLTIENQGDAISYPSIAVTGNASTPLVTNTTTGLKVQFVPGFILANAATMTIDVASHTATNTTTGADVTGSIDFVASTWPGLQKGNNTYTLTGATSMVITWRDCWT